MTTEEMTGMAIVLGANQYGKAEVRMVYVDRVPVHEVTDVNVTSQLDRRFHGHPPDRRERRW